MGKKQIKHTNITTITNNNDTNVDEWRERGVGGRGGGSKEVGG